MTTEHRSLAVFGANNQLAADVQHAFGAVDLATTHGERVAIDTIWTNFPAVLTSPSTGKLVKTRVLDQSSALDLVDIELARFELPDENLSERERVVRNLIVNHLAEGIAPEDVRISYSNFLRRLGGAAIFEGSLNGVNLAAHYFFDLRQIGR